jgi:hypothetical protein
MPKGPVLPRKDVGIARSKEALRTVAFQIGTLVAIERNRRSLTQKELGKPSGIDQVGISRLENGQPLQVSNGKIDSLFGRIGLGVGSPQANFIKWWRDNG